MNQYSLLEKEELFCLHSSEDIFSWLNERKDKLEVKLERISLEECSPWYYENEGIIRNPKGIFFR